MSYNRIMVYKVEYNGLTFLNSPYNIPEGGGLVLKEFSFFEIPTNSSTEKYAITHGEYVSPTEMKNRRVRLLFDIIAKDENERRNLLKKVQRAFTPEMNPSPFNKKLWKNLSFLDSDCIEWNCKCQVNKGVELSDFANEKRVGISVELITDSPYFYSSQEHSLITRNTLMGIKLETKLPIQWQYYKGIINYSGAISTPADMELTILEEREYPFNKIKIIHQGDDGLDVMHIENVNELSLSVGDKILIEGKNRRCYFVSIQGKEDITGLVALGSQRPCLIGGRNAIAVDTGEWEESIEARISWNDVF